MSVNIIKLNKEALENLMKQGLNRKEMAKKLGIAKTQVDAGMKKYGLEIPRSRGGNKIVWEDELTSTEPQPLSENQAALNSGIVETEDIPQSNPTASTHDTPREQEVAYVNAGNTEEDINF